MFALAGDMPTAAFSPSAPTRNILKQLPGLAVAGPDQGGIQMMRTSVSRVHGKLSLILICAALGACSSMQKSSSSSAGEQSAAPITESSQPGDKAAASSSGSPSSSSATSKPGPNSDVNGKPLPADAAAKNEEARQLKRQLDEQDAQINRLRNEQQAEEARLDADTARSQDQQRSAAAAGSQGKPGANDEAAVFPSGDNSATPAGTAAAAAAAAEAAANTGSGAAVAATSERSVYFGYNEAMVSEKYDDMLVANANYLKAHPTFTAEVQGNCDDRGSREYNLALGARRAEAVKRALELAGANGTHITAISYGAEKPVATGHDEESFSKNRRVDIIY
jgi:peptidoglycan-associated lipoprotein